jgi:hypothetical protein
VTCGVALNGGWPRFDAQETRALLFPAGPYSEHVEEHTARNYELAVGDLVDGWNELILQNDGTEELRVIMVELAVLPSLSNPVTP